MTACQEVEVLFEQAIKESGDDKRAQLAQVFGGTCERIGRCQIVLDSIDHLSEQNQADPRWVRGKSKIETIEALLKEMGIFVVWNPNPPKDMRYEGLVPRFSPGALVKMSAVFGEGSGVPYMYTLDKPLPNGLNLNAVTGQITGFLDDVELDETTYVVEGENDKGKCSASLTFMVKRPPPSSLDYSGKKNVVFVGEVLAWGASVEGGNPQEYTVEPALPAEVGLIANKAAAKKSPMGMITGMLNAPAPSTTYTVTAKNTGGQATCALAFEVKLPQLLKLLYPEVQKEYFFKQQLRIVPELTLEKSTTLAKAMDAFDVGAGPRASNAGGGGGILAARMRQVFRQKALAAAGVKFAIAPDLPEGLSISEITGMITGTPVQKTDVISYTVTAKNDVDETTRILNFSVRQVAPENLGFTDVSKVYFTGEPLSLVPAVTGLVNEWTVEPPLPAGLTLDHVTGQIGGLPSEVAEEKAYLVTAKNEEGEAQTSITFAIARAPPKNLDYPEAVPAYAKLRPVQLFPTVEGEVNEFKISPELPAGLTFDGKTGIISGIPTGVAEEKPYEVTAENETGSIMTTVTFAVQVMPPDHLSYPRVDDVYTVGEPVLLEPTVDGGAEVWAIEPPLPAGMSFDVTTGIISGNPTSTRPEQSYTVTATNDAGGTSATLTFAVTAPPPEGLSYRGVQPEYNLNAQCEILPDLSKCLCCDFTISPSLPSGLQMDPKTAVISGTPDSEGEAKTYTVVATNAGGKCEVELTFAVANLDPSLPDPRFIDLVENCTSVAELLALEPDRSKAMGNWMIWMVHRAYMDDESLVDFNFSGLEMPLPHVEERIAPKLMEALATNTHIETLLLSGSNMQKPSGPKMALALQKNTTLKHLNIESNNLDQNSIREMMVNLELNTKTTLNTFRFQNQHGISNYFGRPVEEALCQLMRSNRTLCRIGCAIQDANSRDVINRATMRNVDNERRKNKVGGNAMDDVVAEVKATLKGVTLEKAPEDKQAFEVFGDPDEGKQNNLTLARKAFAEMARVPTQQQFQAYGKNQGKALNFKDAKEIVDAGRMKALNGAVGTEITITDIYGADSKGILRGFTQKNTNWALDIWVGDTKRYSYTTSKDPEIKVSAAFGEWLTHAS